MLMILLCEQRQRAQIANGHCGVPSGFREEARAQQSGGVAAVYGLDGTGARELIDTPGGRTAHANRRTFQVADRHWRIIRPAPRRVRGRSRRGWRCPWPGRFRAPERLPLLSAASHPSAPFRSIRRRLNHNRFLPQPLQKAGRAGDGQPCQQQLDRPPTDIERERSGDP